MPDDTIAAVIVGWELATGAEQTIILRLEIETATGERQRSGWMLMPLLIGRKFARELSEKGDAAEKRTDRIPEPH